MQDLMAEGPAVSADEAFEGEVDLEEGFDEEGMEEDAADEMETYDEMDEGDGFEEDLAEDYAEDDTDLVDELEDVMADALDAEDSDDFLGRLIGGLGSLGRMAGAVGRGARVARGVAGRVGRLAGRAGRMARTAQRTMRAVQGGGQPGGAMPRRGRGGASPGAGVPALLQQLLPLLQQHSQQGSSEMDVFEDVADWFEEDGVDEALPVLGGLAARAAVAPLIRRTGAAVGRNVGRQIVRSAAQSARTLVARQGPRAVRALPRIARSVGRTAVRRGTTPAAVPVALRRTTARVARQPGLARRLATAGPARPASPSTRRIAAGGAVPRRFVVNGPVEIIVRR